MYLNSFVITNNDSARKEPIRNYVLILSAGYDTYKLSKLQQICTHLGASLLKAVTDPISLTPYITIPILYYSHPFKRANILSIYGTISGCPLVFYPLIFSVKVPVLYQVFVSLKSENAISLISPIGHIADLNFPCKWSCRSIKQQFCIDCFLDWKCHHCIFLLAHIHTTHLFRSQHHTCFKYGDER